MRRAAVGEEALLVRHRCRCRGFRQSHPASASRSMVSPGRSNMAWPSRLRRSEKVRIAAIRRDEAVDEFGADLVVAPADRRAEAGDDALALRAERHHRLDGAFEHAGRARPSIRHGRRRSRRLRRRRKGSGRNRLTRTPRTMPGVAVTSASASGRAAVVACVDDDGVWRMDLMDGRKPFQGRRRTSGDASGGSPPTRSAVVVRAEPDIQAAIDALRKPRPGRVK